MGDFSFNNDLFSLHQPQSTVGHFSLIVKTLFNKSISSMLHVQCYDIIY